MKIKFQVHQLSDREVEIDNLSQLRLFEIMKEEFINHITYGSFNSYSPMKLEQLIVSFCEDYGVNVRYEKDRVSFFTALMEQMKFQLEN